MKTKLQPPSSIQGMWNGLVHFKYLGCPSSIRVHVGLGDADRIKSGENPETILIKLLERSGFPDCQILGVKPDRKRKEASSPFSK